MMRGIFSIDGPLYKICNLVYYCMICNLLCFVLAIPGILSLLFIGINSIIGLLVFTILLAPLGPGLTASFYMMRKLQKDESNGPLRDFWKSLKQNFKQSSLAWLIVVGIGVVIYVNIISISVMGSIGKFILPFQFLFAIELLFMGIYIFPIISKYENPLGFQLKIAIMLSNGHLPTTLVCIVVLGIIICLLYYYPAVIFLLGTGIYTFTAIWFVDKVFLKHWPEANEENTLIEE